MADSGQQMPHSTETDPAIERMVLFTDAVLAITITLMALEIRLPEAAGELDDAGLARALGQIWPHYLGYALSFVVVGTYWMNHLRKFRWVRRVTGTLLWLNLAFLLVIGLVPFATSVIAENGGAVATILYAAVMAVSSLLLAGLWAYTVRAGLIDETTPPRQAQASFRQALLFAAVFGVSILIAPLDADAAKYFWLLLIPATLGRRWLARRSGGA
jgi:uncharacterized membrane protein